MRAASGDLDETWGSVIKEAGRACILSIGPVYSLSNALSLYVASGLTIGTCPGRPGGLSTFSCPGQKMENPATRKTGPPDGQAGYVPAIRLVQLAHPQSQSGQKRELLLKGWQGPGVSTVRVRCAAVRTREPRPLTNLGPSRVAQRLTMGREVVRGLSTSPRRDMLEHVFVVSISMQAKSTMQRCAQGEGHTGRR